MHGESRDSKPELLGDGGGDTHECEVDGALNGHVLEQISVRAHVDGVLVDHEAEDQTTIGVGVGEVTIDVLGNLELVAADLDGRDGGESEINRQRWWKRARQRSKRVVGR